MSDCPKAEGWVALSIALRRAAATLRDSGAVDEVVRRFDDACLDAANVARLLQRHHDGGDGDVDELAHALELLAEEAAAGWDGGVVLLGVDPVCRFKPAGGDLCGGPLTVAVVLRSKDAAAILGLCERHARVAEEAIKVWRSRS